MFLAIFLLFVFFFCVMPALIEIVIDAFNIEKQYKANRAKYGEEFAREVRRSNFL